MKLKIQFGSEPHFDQPIRHITRNRTLRSLGLQVLSRVPAMAGRSKPIKPRSTGGIFTEDSSR